MKHHLLLLIVALFSLNAFAKDRRAPCHTLSRQLTMIKNCYSGDMAKAQESGALFFSASPAYEGRSYCYNSLVMVEHQMGEALVRLHVLKDSKDGHFHSFSYNVAPEELLKMRLENPPVALKGLKGECFSANEDKEICKGGLLHAIGFSDVNLPMVVALTKTKHGQFTLGQLITDPKSLSGLKPKELVLAGEQDVTKVTHKIVQDIRRKLVTAAQAKMVSMQNPDMTAKKMGVSSEQFRFCSMAMEGFLKESKLPDPFSPNEKMTLATLTNYMNNEVINPRAPARLPATTAAVKGKTK